MLTVRTIMTYVYIKNESKYHLQIKITSFSCLQKIQIREGNNMQKLSV